VSLPSGPFAYLKQLADVAWVVAPGVKLLSAKGLTQLPEPFKVLVASHVIHLNPSRL